MLDDKYFATCNKSPWLSFLKGGDGTSLRNLNEALSSSTPEEQRLSHLYFFLVFKGRQVGHSGKFRSCTCQKKKKKKTGGENTQLLQVALSRHLD